MKPLSAPQPTHPSTKGRPVVTIERVSHHFGDNPALDGLSLVVPPAKITALLGPNGAGKTTAIRMITGALTPQIGSVRTFGLNPGNESTNVRQRIGVVAAKPALYDRLNGWDNLAYAAALWDIDADRGLMRAAAARFGIDDALDRMVGGYSTGMKTRLALARATLHDPELLLLDEPTSGLDPESSSAVLAMVREMTAEDKTVVLCTHLLSEAEGLADQIVVMETGSTVAAGTSEELVSEYWPNAVVEISAQSPDQLDRLASQHGVLAYARGVVSGHDHTPDPMRLDTACVTLDGFGRVPELVTSLVADGVRITRVVPITPTLEDLYFAIRHRVRTAPDQPLDASMVVEQSPMEVIA